MISTLSGRCDTCSQSDNAHRKQPPLLSKQPCKQPYEQPCKPPQQSAQELVRIDTASDSVSDHSTQAKKPKCRARHVLLASKEQLHALRPAKAVRLDTIEEPASDATSEPSPETARVGAAQVGATKVTSKSSSGASASAT